MNSLIRFFLDPFNIFWLLLIATLTTGLWKKKTWFRWLSILTVFWFLLISTPLVPVIIINSLEDRYEPLYLEQLAEHKAEYHIVVLGGGHGFDNRLPANTLLSSTALKRLNEGIRLHRQLPNSKMVLSGSTSTPGRTTQAEMLEKAAVLLGVDKRSIILQTKPANTCQEARVYADNFGNNHPLILVTSAAHMPRAVMLFKEYELSPIPSATNYRLKGSWKGKRFGFPSISNIVLMKTALFSYAAIIQVKVRQWMGNSCN